MYCVLYFFFFKQKTAYEMRISDWSSDVCSSDLQYDIHRSWSNSRILRRDNRRHDGKPESIGFIGKHIAAIGQQDVEQCNLRAAQLIIGGLSFFISDRPPETYQGRTAPSTEEQRSELQSPMRNSYAVFCLQKKNKTSHILL